MTRTQTTSLAVLGLCLFACGKPARPPSLASEAVATETDAGFPMEADAGEVFNFADDAAGKMLAKMLAPAKPGRVPAGPPSGPIPRSARLDLERPEIPLAKPSFGLPSVPLVKRVQVAPRMLAEPTALDFLHGPPAVPHPPDMPVPPLVRQPSRNVHEPVPLSSLAKPVLDRASLDDPTGDYSAQRAVAAEARWRTGSAQFMRFNLPEPFEHRSSAKPPMNEPGVVPPVPLPPK